MYIWRAICSVRAASACASALATVFLANSSPARTLGVLAHFHIFFETIGFFGPRCLRRAGVG